MKKMIVAVLAFMLLGVNTFAADKYIVVMKDSGKKFLTVTDYKINLKKETLEGIKALQTRVSLLSAHPFQPSQIYWGIKGFSAYLSPQEVASLKASGKVESVIADRRIYIDTQVEPTEEPNAAYTYGLVNTGVKDLNLSNPDITGKGVTVGIIDTGIEDSHPDLKGRVLKFLDVVDRKTAPYDDNGHGTHVAGTISGGNASGTQIGVAPEVKLYVAKVFSAAGGANDTDILEAMQWMMDPDNNPATNDAPAIVSNSWGGSHDEEDITKVPYFKMIQSWKEAGIFPSFAAGNSGPRPDTVGVPGGLPDAFAVGAVDSNNRVASFSSRGPTKWLIDGEMKTFIKPDIAAPGVRVRSSVPGGKYADFSGTSMACPHVSGIAALVKQANPALTPDQISEILNSSATHLGSEGKNADYGNGLINAKAAVLKALSLKK